jgi:2-keto-4-pentenoate hydratase/2-oxohepta-3-ene-1,7-dioic acid hydratase in catechol pathway
MKLVSYSYQNTTSYGVVVGDQVIDLAPLADEAGATLKEAIANGSLEQIAKWTEGDRAGIALSEIEFLPVIPDPEKILCVGINFKTHVAETGRDMPKKPMIFTRFADSQTGHLTPIIRPTASHKLDFEGELAVIIGKTARHVKSADALDYVAGYSCYNDGSIRDWQKHNVQFTPGKNFPNTGGFGPWLVTTDDIPDPSTMSMSTKLNGEIMQQATLDDMIFDVGYIIEYCSTFTTLNPGDVIIMGTTGGVGGFRTPQLWMKPGDIVEIEISDIGILRNSIADE